jgi:hypothetical protein
MLSAAPIWSPTCACGESPPAGTCAPPALEELEELDEEDDGLPEEEEEDAVPDDELLEPPLPSAATHLPDVSHFPPAPHSASAPHLTG